MLLARYTNLNRPCSALWRRLRLQKVKMRNDAINMEVNEGLLAFGAEEVEAGFQVRKAGTGSIRPAAGQVRMPGSSSCGKCVHLYI